jgi:FKBP-type peptidyl-prolyl cis-trans isomerase
MADPENTMRYRILALVMLVAVSSIALLHAQDASPPLDTLEKKVGYGFGFQFGTNLKQQGATLDVDALARGLRDGLAGAKPALDEKTLQDAMMEFQTALRKKQMAEQEKERAAQTERWKKNKPDGIAFLEKNKTAEGVQVTASGLQYKVVKQGQGAKPTPKDTVVVNYEGTLIDGTVFDSSYKRNAPLTFAVTGVIKGWTEGLQLMTVGSTYMFYIPSELAYATAPPPGPIGPDAVLIFKVELLEVKAGT